MTFYSTLTYIQEHYLRIAREPCICKTSHVHKFNFTMMHIFRRECPGSYCTPIPNDLKPLMHHRSRPCVQASKTRKPPTNFRGTSVRLESRLSASWHRLSFGSEILRPGRLMTRTQQRLQTPGKGLASANLIRLASVCGMVWCSGVSGLVATW